MRTYTLLDWDAEHADRLSVKKFYDQRSDLIAEATTGLLEEDANALWCDAMLFLVADWISDRNSEVPLILRDHLNVPPADPDEDFGPVIGLRLADRRNRSDVITVLTDFWNKPAQTREACYVKADVAAAMVAEWNVARQSG